MRNFIAVICLLAQVASAQAGLPNQAPFTLKCVMSYDPVGADMVRHGAQLSEEAFTYTFDLNRRVYFRWASLTLVTLAELTEGEIYLDRDDSLPPALQWYEKINRFSGAYEARILGKERLGMCKRVKLRPIPERAF